MRTPQGAGHGGPVWKAGCGRPGLSSAYSEKKPEKEENEPKDEHEAKDKAPQPESTVEVVDSDEDPEAEYKAKPEDDKTDKQDAVLPVPTKGKKSVIKK